MVIESASAFFTAANDVHLGEYDYSSSVFTKVSHLIEIGCSRHGVFRQKAYAHLKGSGCPKCKRRNGTLKHFTTGHKVTLYFVKCIDESEVFYKIGFTTVSTKERLIAVPYSISILYEYSSPDYESLILIERSLLRLYKQFYYQPRKFFGGCRRETFQFTDTSQIIETIKEMVLLSNQ